jgi:hypothetical protein
MNRDIFVFILMINSMACLLQFLFQEIEKTNGKIPKRGSLIPGTKQKFLYWQDFHVQTFGDFLGLLFIANGFIHLAISGMSSTLWIVFIASGIIFGGLFLKSALSYNHKPDWGFPAPGKISLGGIIHLPYFAILSGMSTVCLITMINGQMKGCLLWSTLGGGIFYVIIFLIDIKKGHFDAIKKE